LKVGNGGETTYGEFFLHALMQAAHDAFLVEKARWSICPNGSIFLTETFMAAPLPSAVIVS
jgi:hypothetical protein